MRLLLDTHIYLWCVTNSKQLTQRAHYLLESADEIYVSSASIWEAAIKIKLKKLEADLDELINAIEPSGFTVLSITPKHAAATFALPEIHRDPFDRMLIAQAIVEPLRFVTADTTLKDYSDLIELV